jgi:hypothetical protein
VAGRVCVLKNSHPKGFGANHNAAFQVTESPYFAVVNPDIRLGVNPFPALLASWRNRWSRCARLVW